MRPIKNIQSLIMGSNASHVANASDRPVYAKLDFAKTETNVNAQLGPDYARIGFGGRSQVCKLLGRE